MLVKLYIFEADDWVTEPSSPGRVDPHGMNILDLVSI